MEYDESQFWATFKEIGWVEWRRVGRGPCICGILAVVVFVVVVAELGERFWES